MNEETGVSVVSGPNGESKPGKTDAQTWGGWELDIEDFQLLFRRSLNEEPVYCVSLTKIVTHSQLLGLIFDVHKQAWPCANDIRQLLNALRDLFEPRDLFQPTLTVNCPDGGNHDPSSGGGSNGNR